MLKRLRVDFDEDSLEHLIKVPSGQYLINTYRYEILLKIIVKKRTYFFTQQINRFRYSFIFNPINFPFFFLDDDGEVRLNQNDFLQWIKALQNLKPDESDDEASRKNLVEAFKVFDLNDDGYISKDELKSAMETIREPLTDQQLDELISYADIDKDGRINYEGK